MSGVRLALKHLNPSSQFRFVLPGGSVQTLPTLRLCSLVDLSAIVIRGYGQRTMKAAFPDCILDTGSHLATVPEYIHSMLMPGTVTAFPFHASVPSRSRRLILANGTFPYWLGSVAFKMRDLHGGSLDVSLVAQFVEDRGALDHLPLILGLQGGLIEGRTLTAKPDAAEPHGQSWFLEE